jgi:methyl-accepting chemotaxis protein
MFEIRLQDIPMRRKLLWLLLAAGGTPLLLIGLVSITLAMISLMSQFTSQLEAVRELKKFQIERYFENRERDLKVLTQTASTLKRESLNRLVAIRDNKQKEVQRYLGTIESQARIFSESKMVVEALRQFAPAFQSMALEGLDAEQRALHQSSVQSYYERVFSTQYQAVSGGDVPDVQARLKELDDAAVVAQSYYIANNAFPLGEKDRLDRAPDGSRYSEVHADYHPLFRNYLREFGYYDIFLVDSATGDIVYSVFKELDFGTSLKDGPFAQTNFAEAFRKANAASRSEGITLVDFQPYWPSYEAPAAFVASPVFDESGFRLGVVVFQFPIDRFNEIMTSRAGLGETGEAYLVGPDFLMRSDSYLDSENRSLVQSFRNPEQGSVRTKAAQRGLSGETGSGLIQDYRGEYVLSAWAPLEFGDLNWAILAEIDVLEALNPKNAASQEFYAEYKQLYGYYDLFLIHPEGQAFYTVERESDYHTNLLTGPYADSNLGQLVRKVLDTRQAGFADFAPYEPSSFAPVAFIAAPTLQQGEVDLIVALQLPIDAINRIMQERTGMGETGETYLVGPDFLMRSDSYLDAKGHSVEASFAGTVERNGVQSEASQAAISGRSGSEFITDYNGNTVLSAYAPVTAFDTQWAILAEVDRSEILGKILPIPLIILVLGTALLLGLVAVARRVSQDITTPLAACVSALRAISMEGNLRVDVAVEQHDEIGEMAEALKVMVSRLNESLETVKGSAKELSQGSSDLSGASHALSERTTEQAASLEEISSNLSMLSERTSQNSDIAGQANQMTQKVNQSAQQSSLQMQEFAENMEAIRASTQDISKIIVVIGEIAFQTKMLAINASIEAARAGEHGKGFSVVAEEIQGLARSTTESAEEIKKLITTSVGQVSSSNGMMKSTLNSLEQILKSAQETTALMQDIRNSAQDQARGVQEINVAVEQMSVVTQENSQLAEKNASTSNQIKGLAGGLDQIVSQFQLRNQR